MNRQRNNLKTDAAIVVISVIVAVILVKTGAIKGLLAAAQGMEIWGSLIAGVFFVSGFTVAPATVVLASIAQTHSALTVAALGGLGALFGDLVIFSFIKDRLAGDLEALLEKTHPTRLLHVFHLRFFRWLLPFFGALIIASPLPNEIGITIMGLSKIKTYIFVPMLFALNFLGILTIGLIAGGKI